MWTVFNSFWLDFFFKFYSSLVGGSSYVSKINPLKCPVVRFYTSVRIKYNKLSNENFSLFCLTFSVNYKISKKNKIWTKFELNRKCINDEKKDFLLISATLWYWIRKYRIRGLWHFIWIFSMLIFCSKSKIDAHFVVSRSFKF